MRKLAKVLKTEISGDLEALAKMLQGKGRGKDTILAHITPKEAAFLKERGGSGTRNPDTGLLEYDDTLAPVETTAQYVPVPTGGSIDAGPTTLSYDGSSGPGTYNVPATASSSFTPAADQFASANAPSGAGAGMGTIDNASAGYGVSSVAPSFTTATPNVAAPDISGTQQQMATDISQAGLPSAASKPWYENQNLQRLGLSGGLGILGAVKNRQAAGQIAGAQRQQQALAQPYQTMGNQLIGQANQGILSPASQQAYQAAQAQLTQNAQNRGGVGVEQAQSQLAAIRQNLLATQMQYGLQIAQVGDKMALGAIQTGMALDQQLNQTSQDFYTQLASIAAGIPAFRAGA